jgi:protease I
MKKALILTWEKFQDHEVIYPFYALQEHGYGVEVCANATKERIWGILGSHIVSDYTTNELSVDLVSSYDLLCIPGGVKALEKLRLEPNAVEFVKAWFGADKPTMCICNGGQLLITADVLRGRKCSGYYSIEPDIRNAGAEYDRGVVVDGNLISCAHYDDMGEWMRKSMEQFND